MSTTVPNSAPRSPVATAPEEPSHQMTVVAHSEVDVLDVYAKEDDPEPERQLDRRVETTGQLVFVVEGATDRESGRYRVQLPVRPNGSVGWVRGEDVSLSTHPFRIEVALGEHRLRLLRSGDLVEEVPIGVGTVDTPTPGGTYYIKELLQPPSPDGVYGPYAYGLSGFSNVLTSFSGGDGVIGIHGTNTPDAIGTDVSSGCIRVENEVIVRFAEDLGLPLGLPVDISA